MLDLCRRWELSVQAVSLVPSRWRGAGRTGASLHVSQWRERGGPAQGGQRRPSAGGVDALLGALDSQEQAGTWERPGRQPLSRVPADQLALPAGDLPTMMSAHWYQGVCVFALPRPEGHVQYRYVLRTSRHHGVFGWQDYRCLNMYTRNTNREPESRQL